MKITRNQLRRVISEVLTESDPVGPGPGAAELRSLAKMYLSSSDLKAAGYGDWVEESTPLAPLSEEENQMMGGIVELMWSEPWNKEQREMPQLLRRFADDIEAGVRRMTPESDE